MRRNTHERPPPGPPLHYRGGVRITATVITLNEEAKLAACLRSVSWADEVIVVDAGSTDATVDIANAMGARVIHQDWLGFVAQKNAAARFAKNDWVLNVDADERISRTFVDGLSSLNWNVNRYAVYRVTDFLGQPHRPMHIPAEETLVRLYDRRLASFAGEAVHEKVTGPGDAGRAAGTIYHEGFRSIDDLVNRLNKYSGLLSLEQSNTSGGWLQIVGRPVAHFAWSLLRNRAVLDGRRGVGLAALWAFHDLLVALKTYERSLPVAQAFPEQLYFS